jgi:hypothetical protein
LTLGIALLTMPPHERLPFLVRHARLTLTSIGSACDGLAQLLPPDPPAHPHGLPDQLPSDLSIALEREAMRSGNEGLQDRFRSLVAARDRDDQIRLAIALAVDLPPRFWPVRGRLVADYDLQAALCGERASP